VPWWVRHKEKVDLAEMILTGLFFLLALYFLYLWIAGDSSPVALTGPDPAWKVAATPGRWTQIVVHHTGTAAGTAESIDRNHREVRKWENGLGYHFLIGNGKRDDAGQKMDDGEVHMSRRWREQLDGAHVRMKDTKKGTSFSIGIALVGNLEETPPTPAQVSALHYLLAFLTAEYGIPKERIVGHGDVSAQYTACPGAKLPLGEIVGGL
jgi:N-acetyl-anhydromuramyl-L-alanine amidase AmpD